MTAPKTPADDWCYVTVRGSGTRAQTTVPRDLADRIVEMMLGDGRTRWGPPKRVVPSTEEDQ